MSNALPAMGLSTLADNKQVGFALIEFLITPTRLSDRT